MRGSLRSLKILAEVFPFGEFFRIRSRSDDFLDWIGEINFLDVLGVKKFL